MLTPKTKSNEERSEKLLKGRDSSRWSQTTVSRHQNRIQQPKLKQHL